MIATEVAIRPLRRDDAAAAASVLREVDPHWIATAALVEHWFDHTPARAQWQAWVGESGGRIVAWADAELAWDKERADVGQLWIGVLPEARQRGIGSRLYDLAEAHLRAAGAHVVRSQFEGDDGAAFVRARGFGEVRQERVSKLDTARADLSELDDLEARARAEGFEVVPLRDVIEREEELHALYDETQQDMPSDVERASLAFDDWRRDTLANPLLDLDASMNVLDDGRPVAFAWLLVDREGGRGEHELTGTLRAYRGRGLARLAKLAALRWCRENGVHTLLTGNDTTNAPMLAINERLGYEPTVVLRVVSKQL